MGQVPSCGGVGGSVVGERGNHTLMFLSLSPCLPLSLKINKIFKRIFMSLISSEIGHIFLYVYWACGHSLLYISCSSPVYFLLDCVYLPSQFVPVLYIFLTLILCQLCVVSRHLSLFCDLSFTLFMVIFCHKIFNSNVVKSDSIFLCGLCFGFTFKKSFSILMF